MHTEALKLIREYEQNAGGFRYFSDWLDARKVDDVVSERAQEIYRERADAD